MKKLANLFPILAIMLLSGCEEFFPGTVRGESNVIQEARQVQGVSGVDLATLGDLTIEIGAQEGLVIEAEENLLPYIETSLLDGVLTIQNPPGVNIQPTQPVRYTLTVKSLESLAVSSSGNITAPALEAENFEISIRSSGNIDLEELTCQRLEVEISSSGDLRIAAGEVSEQVVKIHSSGAYEASEVRSQTAQVEIQSNGNATLWVTERLESDLSSSGNVYYYGQPEVTERTSSSGKVVSRGEK